MTTRTMERGRSTEAAMVLGPVGHLFGSATTARLLSLLAAEPFRAYTLGEFVARTRTTKTAVHAALVVLQRCQLARRQGSGPRTSYRYAPESELAQRMREL